MWDDSSPVHSLPYIQPAQAQKHVTHNEAVRILDVITQLSVPNPPAPNPPVSPAKGARYIVGNSATADWTGHDDQIAVWIGTFWEFHTALPGWVAVAQSNGEAFRFDGSSWVSMLQNLPQIGVGTSADTTNRLSIASEATLLTNVGAGHQLKVNKANAADTASLLFQTGWSGRAEMGTAGSDDFAVKVSPDGSAWFSGINIQASSGAVQVPSGQTFFQDVFISNDAAWSFDIPWSDPSRVLLWIGLDQTGWFALNAVTGTLAGAANITAISTGPSTTQNTYTGALTGTDGDVGSMNISIDPSGGTPKLYVENRTGTDAQFTLATLGR